MILIKKALNICLLTVNNIINSNTVLALTNVFLKRRITKGKNVNNLKRVEYINI